MGPNNGTVTIAKIDMDEKLPMSVNNVHGDENLFDRSIASERGHHPQDVIEAVLMMRRVKPEIQLSDDEHTVGVGMDHHVVMNENTSAAGTAIHCTNGTGKDAKGNTINSIDHDGKEQREPRARA